MAALLRGLLRRRGGPPVEELARATGQPRTVHGVHPAERAGRIGLRGLPLPGLPAHGGLLHLATVGPTLVRPGDLEDPIGQALRGVVELTVVLQGSVEFSDGLGSRGRLDAPGCRLVAGGAGLVSLVGPSRDLRRDGGHLHIVTLRWRQSVPMAVPTARMATEIPTRRQGRSTITAWAGRDAAVPSSDGTSVWTVRLAAGAGVDLAVGADALALVMVLQGGVLIGGGLVPTDAGQVVILADDGPRLQLATKLEQAGGALVLVAMTTTALDPSVVVGEEGRLVAESSEAMMAVREHLIQGGFGTLPALDG